MEVIKIQGWNPDEVKELIPVRVHMWYDRHLRLWRVWKESEEGYQVDDSVYVEDKETAKLIKKDMEEEIK